MKMKKLLVCIALLTILSMMLTACGTNSSTPEPAPAAEETGTEAAATETAAETEAAETEENGEHVLNVLCGGQQVSLEVLEASTGSSNIVSRALYDCLWDYYSDDPTNFHFNIATGYEYNDDQTVMTIKLRDDACFSDGTPITAEDILFTLNYYVGTTQSMAVEVIDFENSYVEDDQTLVLTFTAASPVIADNFAGLKMVSKAAYESGDTDKLAFEPVSSGAYMIETFETGEPIVLVKNPYYYAADELYYDKVVLTCISNENSRYLTFQSDDAYDIMTINSNEYVAMIRDGDTVGAHLQSTAMQCLVYMAFNTYDYPQFADVNIRAAIAHAVDWETMVYGICGDDYTIATSCLLPHVNWAYYETGVYEYDPELAAEYLEKAGYKPGEFSFTCRIADEDFNAEICEAMQAYLSEVGITMNISLSDSPTVRAEIRNNELECGIAKAMGSGDPTSVVRSRVSTTPANLYHMVATPDQGESYLRDLFDEASYSNEGREYRIGLYEEVQQLMFDYYNCYPLYETNAFLGVRDSLGDIAAACETSMGDLCLSQLTNDLVASW